MKQAFLLAFALFSVVALAPAAEKKIWAKSYLNQKAPELAVEKWLTAAPDAKGKFVLRK